MFGARLMHTASWERQRSGLLGSGSWGRFPVNERRREVGMIAYAAQRAFHWERYNIMSSHSAQKNIRLIAHDAIQSSTYLCC